MKPHLVIDARLFGSKHTGIGRYVENLLLGLVALPQFQTINTTLLVQQTDKLVVARKLGKHVSYVPVAIPHYSLAEQVQLPALLDKLQPDLLHVPHFNYPIFWPGKTLLTIHDLIKHYFRGPNTSTRQPMLYWPKYLAYRLLCTTGLRRAKHIIVPTHFWETILHNNYHIPTHKITVTHEAVDPVFSSTKTDPFASVKAKYHIRSPYLCYVGNLYPHKNVTVVLQALRQLPWLQFYISCARSYFTANFQKEITKANLTRQVHILGFVPDSEQKALFQNAFAFVFPSLLEGFGLPALEAMSCACPVISSNASCLPEVYKKAVLYFNPTSSADLVDQITKLRNNQALRTKLIKAGLAQAKHYSWHTTAKQTLTVYQSLLGS